MIRLNDDYTFERDAYGWTLHHWYDTKNKNGQPIRRSRQTYHANLRQICSVVLDEMGGRCESMEALTALMTDAENAIHVVVSEHRDVAKQAAPASA